MTNRKQHSGLSGPCAYCWDIDNAIRYLTQAVEFIPRRWDSPILVVIRELEAELKKCK